MFTVIRDNGINALEISRHLNMLSIFVINVSWRLHASGNLLCFLLAVEAFEISQLVSLVLSHGLRAILRQQVSFH